MSTKINLCIIVSETPRSGVSIRLSKEVFSLLSQKETPNILAFSPTKNCPLANVVEFLGVDGQPNWPYNNSVADWNLLDVSANLSQNVYTITSAVERTVVKLESCLGKRIAVLIDSDGVFDNPVCLKELLSALKNIQTASGELDLTIGVHMDPHLTFSLLSENQPVLAVYPENYTCVYRLVQPLSSYLQKDIISPWA